MRLVLNRPESQTNNTEAKTSETFRVARQPHYIDVDSIKPIYFSSKPCPLFPINTQDQMN